MNSRERFLAACRSEQVDRPPVWIMRQAGRYLPEYRAIREKHGFWEMMRIPELAVEVTLQPLRRFQMDAAIMFSDILIALDAMGARVEYGERGPVIQPLVRDQETLLRLRPVEAARDFAYVREIIERLCSELHPHTAVIGFAGAPLTLAAYLIEDNPQRKLDTILEMARKHPEILHGILDRLTETVTALLVLQAQAGADAVQVFDTWAGNLPRADYAALALPYATKVITNLRSLGVPVIYYVRNSAALLECAAGTGCTVLSLDSSIPLTGARRRLGPLPSFQGNLDLALLHKPDDVIRSAVHEMITSVDGSGLIYNLGQGLTPDVPVAGVESVARAVQLWARPAPDAGRKTSAASGPARRSAAVDPALRAKYDVRGPRYTSYPPASHFHPIEAAEVFAGWQRRNGMPDDPGLSLYFHIPFCRTRCLFCGCHTYVGKKAAAVEAYLEALNAEMEIAGRYVSPERIVRQVALGGGTPNYVSPEQSDRLLAGMRRLWRIAPDAELSAEIDPRTATPPKLDVLLRHGFNRISLGIQDFSENVIRRIRRDQGLMQIEEVVGFLRARGCHTINFDLIYGLPGQDLSTAEYCAGRVIALRPTRIALYNYAHLPEIFPHQKVLEDAGLPDPDLKTQIFLAMKEAFLAAGYALIGMDHFALPEDPLATAFRERTLRRNFMGYMTGRGLDLLAFGASAISSIGATYSQNEKSLDGYQAKVGGGALPIVRGFLLNLDDEIRRELLLELFCNFHLDLEALSQKFGIDAAAYLAPEIERLQPMVLDGLVRVSRSAIDVSDQGRYFIRNLCMTFDRYLAKEAGTQIYSRTV